MQDLTVVGVESGTLLLASHDGTRFRVPVDEALQSKLRQALPVPATERKLAPREVQAHIRAGMSAEDVAAVTGASLEYIQRFEGPVIAEREFVIESALNVPVSTAADADPLGDPATFGSVIRQRLADAGATGERWASWKEQGGEWIVKLEFTAENVDRDGRWTFDPRKHSLSPLNSEAVSLSQQGELPQSLIPRLRAVPSDLDESGSPRFDSGAFAVEDDGQSLIIDAIPFTRDAEPAATNQTSDLLEALRRRRGEREAATPEALDHDEALAAHPSSGSIRLVDVPLDGLGDDSQPEAPSSASSAPRDGISRDPRDAAAREATPAPASPRDTGSVQRLGAKKGRAAMPSWDEIVFGARSDED